MNRKIKINDKRRVLGLSATFFGLLLALSACKKEETNIGDNLQDASLNVATVDTFTVVTYSDELEDMESDETNVNLLGAYNDPVFGGVNCGIVTQIVPEALTQDFPNVTDLVMDSVILSLRFTSINYYANLDDITVEVFEIGDVLQRENQIYAVSETPTLVSDNLTYDDPAVLSPDIVKNVVVGDDTLSPQLRIRLKNSVGVELVEDSKAGLMGADFATSTFKGLYIRIAVDEGAPGFGLVPGQGTVLYFALEDALSKMTIYYHTVTDVYDKFDFDINTTCARYNRITYDRQGTMVEEALEDKAVGEDLFYLQGAAVRAVVEFPYIKDFFTTADGSKDPKVINKAVLVLPVQDFQPDVFDPSAGLFIVRVEDDKKSDYTDDYGLGSKPVEYDEENKEFRFTMTQEIHSLLVEDAENVGYRILNPGFFGSTIERIVFNGSKSTLKERPRLEITYTDY